ncbi:omptin family outer membrane protease [Vagococcus sp. WN89Y]|uniref:omptin family outer membrane protease n=1 Tax=Vagococcus sp. WN89Y TaxID=3457258 RepID=UPI003FCCC0C8
MLSKKFIAPGLVMIFSAPGYAGDNLFTPEKISASLSTGLLGGQAKERVYDSEYTGRKISQLNWKYNNAAIIKADILWDVSPWASLGASGWTTIASKGGYMEDYDWMDDSQSHWTDKSYHPDTKLNYANNFDFNLTGWLLNEQTYRFGATAGYQKTSFSWSSHGGYYNYDNGATVGESAPGERGIGYKQSLEQPYIGLVAAYWQGKWEFRGAFKYSLWGKAKDNDEHYSRNTTFRDSVRNQKYHGLSALIGYRITETTKISLMAEWNKVANKKGKTTMYDREDDVTEHYSNAAGIANNFYTVTVGATYYF